MPKQVIIIGNSGAARECYWYLNDVCKEDSSLKFKGFLSFEGYQKDLFELAPLLLGDDENYVAKPDDVFIIGVGSARLRKQIYEKWKARGACFINLIATSCFIAPTSDLGEANVFGLRTSVSDNVTIGVANFFNAYTTLAHDVVVGDANFFGPRTMLLGNCSVGNENELAVNSVLLPNARIGNNNIIAPGAYIYKGCKNYCFMAGNPALKERSLLPADHS